MLPPLVRRAVELEREQGRAPSCTVEQGRLLHVLAGERGRTRVAALGAGDAAAAWIVSALAPQVPFFTAAPGELFRDDPNVHVRPGDWRATVAPEAPFDLLAVGAPEAGDAAAAVGLLVAGGLAVVLSPPPTARESWVDRTDVAATELLTPAGDATILAVRR